MEIIFFGTCGSCGYNNGKRSRYGTNTLCVAIKAGDAVIILDAGFGICGFNNSDELESEKYSLFFSHYHYDHIQGLLFWKALFDPDKEINMYGEDVYATMKDYFGKPYQPVGVIDLCAKITYNNIKSGDEIQISPDVLVKCIAFKHPQDCLGFRIEYNGKSVCYYTDIELGAYTDTTELAEFASGTDLLIADAAFSDENIIPGFGHSTPTECADLAAKAGAKRLALYHYGYMETDGEIDALVETARKKFKTAFGAADGMKIIL